MKTIQIIAMAITMSVGLPVQAAPDKPAASEQDPEAVAARKEWTAANQAVSDKLAEISPAFAAAVEAYKNATKAASKDKENPELQKAAQEAIANFFKVRGAELKAMQGSNEELAELVLKAKEATNKVHAYGQVE